MSRASSLPLCLVLLLVVLASFTAQGETIASLERDADFVGSVVDALYNGDVKPVAFDDDSTCLIKYAPQFPAGSDVASASNMPWLSVDDITVAEGHPLRQLTPYWSQILEKVTSMSANARDVLSPMTVSLLDETSYYPLVSLEAQKDGSVLLALHPALFWPLEKTPTGEENPLLTMATDVYESTLAFLDTIDHSVDSDVELSAALKENLRHRALDLQNESNGTDTSCVLCTMLLSVSYPIVCEFGWEALARWYCNAHGITPYNCTDLILWGVVVTTFLLPVAAFAILHVCHNACSNITFAMVKALARVLS